MSPSPVPQNVYIAAIAVFTGEAQTWHRELVRAYAAELGDNVSDMAQGALMYAARYGIARECVE